MTATRNSTRAAMIVGYLQDLGHAFGGHSRRERQRGVQEIRSRLERTIPLTDDETVLVASFERFGSPDEAISTFDVARQQSDESPAGFPWLATVIVVFVVGFVVALLLPTMLALVPPWN